MKIIKKSNFDTESVADVLVVENVPDEYVECMVDALNDKYSSENSHYYFHSKEDSYVLWRGMEEFVDAVAEPSVFDNAGPIEMDKQSSRELSKVNMIRFIKIDGPTEMADLNVITKIEYQLTSGQWLQPVEIKLVKLGSSGVIYAGLETDDGISKLSSVIDNTADAMRERLEEYLTKQLGKVNETLILDQAISWISDESFKIMNGSHR